MSKPAWQEEWDEYPNRLEAMTEWELKNEAGLVFQGRSNRKIDCVRKEILKRKRAGKWDEQFGMFVREGYHFEVLTQVGFILSDIQELEEYARHHAQPRWADEILPGGLLYKMRAALVDKSKASMQLTTKQLHILCEITSIGTTEELASDILNAISGREIPHSRDLRNNPSARYKADLNWHFHTLLADVERRSNEVNTLKAIP